MLLLFMSISTAQAAEPTGTLTLACEGTATSTASGVTDDANPEATSIGIIVDFAARTVEFGHEFKFPIKISTITETTISFFGGLWSDPILMYDVNGPIDRASHAVEIHVYMREKGGSLDTNYSLKCKPT
jgi:hypothetical protein